MFVYEGLVVMRLSMIAAGKVRMFRVRPAIFPSDRKSFD